MFFDSKAEYTGPQECPACGTLDCGHTTNEMQGFALDALVEASQLMGLYDIEPTKGETNGKEKSD
jgi:hypothetical protein